MEKDKVQRLSEGYDFIEESTSFSDDTLSFSDASQIEISEGESSKSPYKILGKASGCFAPIGEFSRNKRLYSDDLWPTVLANEEFSSRLAHRAVFGCLGHEDKLVDDRDIQEGKVSHIVTKLEVREDLNHKPYLYGELEILDTPAGRILEAMYKGGANLYVSSRAAGKLYPVPGQNYSLVKPESYHVHCFDIVARPGFLQAQPAFEAVTPEVTAPVMQEAKVTEEVEKGTSLLPKSIKPSAVVSVSSTTANWAPVVTEEAMTSAISESQFEIKDEVSELKGQVEKLAKIIEKVVDDVYEDVQEQPIVKQEEDKTDVKVEEKGKETPIKEEIPEALHEFFHLLAETNISDEAVQEILQAIFNDREAK